jgi:FkbM family methyltransferase
MSTDPAQIRSSRAYQKYKGWNQQVKKGDFSSAEQEVQDFLQMYFKPLSAVSGYRGLVVDVGANDGVTDSHSLPFIEQGWSALLIEPHPDMYALIHSLYKDVASVQMRQAAVHNAPSTEISLYSGRSNHFGHSTLVPPADRGDWDHQKYLDDSKTFSVTASPLTEILEDCGIKRKIDILHVDAEGMGLEVLRSLDYEVYDPTIISVDIMGPHHEGTADDPLATSLAEWMAKTGYECVVTHAQSIWKKR